MRGLILGLGRRARWIFAVAFATCSSPDGGEDWRELREQVARVRGLEWREPPRIRNCDAATMAGAWRRSAGALDPLADGGLRTRGILPPARPEGILADAPLAFYSAPDKTIYLCDGVGPNALTSVLAHELCHALEDQHFGYERLLHIHANDLASLFALRCLMEGSAEEVRHRIQPDDASGAPSIVPRTCAPSEENRGTAVSIFHLAGSALPHVVGPDFVRRVLADAGWPAIDRMYATPPSDGEILGTEVGDVVAARSRIESAMARWAITGPAPAHRRWWGVVHVAGWLDCLIRPGGGVLRRVRAAHDAFPSPAAMRVVSGRLLAALCCDFQEADGLVPTADVLEFRSEDGARAAFEVLRVGLRKRPGPEVPEQNADVYACGTHDATVARIRGARIAVALGCPLATGYRWTAELLE